MCDIHKFMDDLECYIAPDMEFEITGNIDGRTIKADLCAYCAEELISFVNHYMSTHNPEG